jgi:hypothetical protein
VSQGKYFLFLRRVITLFREILSSSLKRLLPLPQGESLFLEENLINPPRRVFSLRRGECDHSPRRLFTLSPKRLFSFQGGFSQFLGEVILVPQVLSSLGT